MKKTLIALVTASAATLAACGGSTSAPTTTVKPAVKVDVIYFGSPESNSWSYANQLALSPSDTKYIDFSTSENITDDSNAELVLEQAAAAGNKLIFATWPGYNTAVEKVAAKYPKTCFQVAGEPLATPLKNVGTYTADFNEGRYRSGMAAGAVTKSGTIGFIAAFPTPQAVSEINAFTLGALAMNSEAKVQVTWTATKFDELIEQQAAESLIRAGADVVAQSTHSAGPGTAAEANGVLWVGNNVNRPDLAPKAWVTAPTWDFLTYAQSAISSVVRGDCPADHYVASRANKSVLLAEFGPAVSEATRAEIGKAVPDLSSIEGKTDFIDGVIGSAKG